MNLTDSGFSRDDAVAGAAVDDRLVLAAVAERQLDGVVARRQTREPVVFLGLLVFFFFILVVFEQIKCFKKKLFSFFPFPFFQDTRVRGLVAEADAEEGAEVVALAREHLAELGDGGDALRRVARAVRDEETVVVREHAVELLVPPHRRHLRFSQI